MRPASKESPAMVLSIGTQAMSCGFDILLLNHSALPSVTPTPCVQLWRRAYSADSNSVAVGARLCRLRCATWKGHRTPEPCSLWRLQDDCVLREFWLFFPIFETQRPNQVKIRKVVIKRRENERNLGQCEEYLFLICQCNAELHYVAFRSGYSFLCVVSFSQGSRLKYRRKKKKTPSMLCRLLALNCGRAL